MNIVHHKQAASVVQAARDGILPNQRSDQFTFSIPLKPQSKPVEFPRNFDKLIYQDFIVKYCESISVTPTPQNIEMIKKELPIEKCRMTAAWKSRGWNNDCINVQPLPFHASSENFYVARPKDVVHSVLNHEQSIFSNMLQEAGKASSSVAVIDSHAVAAPVSSPSNSNNASQAGPQSIMAPKNVIVNGKTMTTEKLKSELKQASQTFESSHFTRANIHAAPKDYKNMLYLSIKQKHLENSGFAQAPTLTNLSPTALQHKQKKQTAWPQPATPNTLSSSLPSSRQSMSRNIASPKSMTRKSDTDDDSNTVVIRHSPTLQQQREDNQDSDSDFQADLSHQQLELHHIDNVHDRALQVERIRCLEFDHKATKLAQSVFSASPTLALPQLHSFCTAFLKEFPHYRSINVDDVTFAKYALTSTPTTQLIALACHYIYWACFGAFSALPLASSASHSLFVVLTRCHLHLDQTLKKHSSYSMFLLPLFLDLLHAVVKHVFTTNYPTWFTHSQFSAPSLARINLLVDALFDPNFRISSLQRPQRSALPSKLLGPNVGTRVRDIAHSTSTYIRTIFPRPHSVGVRQMFQQARHDRRKDHHDLNHQASTASLFNQQTQHDDGDQSGNGAKLGSFGVVGLHTPDLPVALKDLVPSLSASARHSLFATVVQRVQNRLQASFGFVADPNLKVPSAFAVNEHDTHAKDGTDEKYDADQVNELLSQLQPSASEETIASPAVNRRSSVKLNLPQSLSMSGTVLELLNTK